MFVDADAVTIKDADKKEADEETPDAEKDDKAGTDNKQINNTSPAWTKKPADLTPQDYQDFYKELYPFGETPL